MGVLFFSGREEPLDQLLHPKLGRPHNNRGDNKGDDGHCKSGCHGGDDKEQNSDSAGNRYASREKILQEPLGKLLGVMPPR